MVRVGNCGKFGIIENGCGFHEADAMFFDIGVRFFIVPFKVGIFHDGCLTKLYRVDNIAPIFKTPSPIFCENGGGQGGGYLISYVTLTFAVMVI